MNEENLHINDSQPGLYPDPEIPVAEAWAAMEKLLEEEDRPIAAPGSGSVFRKYFLLALLLLIAIIALFISRPLLEESKRAVARKNIIAADSAVSLLLSPFSGPDTTGSVITTSSGNDPAVLLQNEELEQPHPDSIKASVAIAERKQQFVKLDLPITRRSHKKSLVKEIGFEKHFTRNVKAGLLPASPVKNEGLPAGQQRNGKEQVAIPAQQTGSPQNTGVEKKPVEEGHADLLLLPSKGNADSLDKGVKDSAAWDLPKDKEQKNKRRLLRSLAAGLQWTPLLPFGNSRYYSAGTDGKNKPYMSLLPGLWVMKKWKKQAISLEVMPQQLMYRHRLLSVASERLSPLDTLQVERRIYLLKSAGFTTGFRYNYALSRHWQIGAGVYYVKQNRALQRDLVQNQGITIVDSVYSVKLSGNNAFLRSFFISGKAEMVYTIRQLQVGLSMQAPFTGLSSSGGKIRPLSGQLVVRWSLFGKE